MAQNLSGKPVPVPPDFEALGRLEEFKTATDGELADAVRLLAGIFPDLCRGSKEKRSRLAITITYLVRT